MRKAPVFAVVVAVVAALVLGSCAGGSSSESSEFDASSGLASSADSATRQSSNPPVVREDEASVPSKADSPSASTGESHVLMVGANGQELQAEFAESAAADALAERLAEGPVTVGLREYGGFEKVGPLPWGLPANDEQIVGQPGDILLYQGGQITVFYGSNSYSYTRLAHIDGATHDSLLAALGDGPVEVTLSLA